MVLSWHVSNDFDVCRYSFVLPTVSAQQEAFFWLFSRGFEEEFVNTTLTVRKPVGKQTDVSAIALI